MAEIQIEGLRELEDLADRLKAAGRGDLQRKLRKNIEQAVTPITGQLRAAALGIQITSSRGGRARPDSSTGLRRRLAAAVDVRKQGDGVRIVVDADQVDPAYGAALPRYSDGEIRRYRRWRHPVFGRRDNPNDWQNQTGSPWFFATIRRNRGRVEAAVARAMDDVARDIQR